MVTSAKDLRINMKRALETVERGEEVVITHRGKACAKIIPLEKGRKSAKFEKTELFGIWKDNPVVNDVGAYVRRLRSARK